MIRNRVGSIEELEMRIKETADKECKDTYRRRRERNDGDGEEPTWMNKEPRKERRERKHIK